MNHVEWVISKQIERTENNTMPVQELTHNSRLYLPWFYATNGYKAEFKMSW